MEEKKLTDDEIVKDLERYNDEQTIENALDLIRRLQYGYSSASKASEEWKEKYEKERKENAEQKAEIERLNRQVERNKERIVREMNIGYANERQAVKDTAKEILQQLWDETEPNTKSHEWIRKRIKEIAKRKGVEVEQ